MFKYFSRGLFLNFCINDEPSSKSANNAKNPAIKRAPGHKLNIYAAIVLKARRF